MSLYYIEILYVCDLMLKWITALFQFIFVFYFISFIDFTGGKTNKYNITKSRLQNRNTPVRLQKRKLNYCRVDLLMLPLRKQTNIETRKER